MPWTPPPESPERTAWLRKLDGLKNAERDLRATHTRHAPLHEVKAAEQALITAQQVERAAWQVRVIRENGHMYTHDEMQAKLDTWMGY